MRGKKGISEGFLKHLAMKWWICRESASENIAFDPSLKGNTYPLQMNERTRLCKPACR